ncbi:NAD(P)H-dependent flavin oxidoreductase, partial [Listeria monocytogenes]|uniref:NAD(P)H-dependent flavin oxidoreductase n=1 Tax=Listeria monocytogenes TaxID=1639 RepID=UPI000B193F84
SNAGGLGIIASGGMTADMLREEIKKTKTLTDKPFGVNLMLMMTNIAELTEGIIEEKVGIVTTGSGTPKPFMPIWREAGIIVIPVVPSGMIAKRMEKMGADAVIAEGTE